MLVEYLNYLQLSLYLNFLVRKYPFWSLACRFHTAKGRLTSLKGGIYAFQEKGVYTLPLLSINPRVINDSDQVSGAKSISMSEN